MTSGRIIPGDWKAAHGASLNESSGAIVFSDDTSDGWHLMRLSDPRLCGHLRVSIEAAPVHQSSKDLYINHWGGHDILHVSRDGRIITDNTGGASVSLRGDALIVDAEFINSHPTLSIGTSMNGSGRYRGTAEKQYRFDRIAVLPLPKDRPIDLMVVVDVGASGGLKSEWQPVMNSILPVLFEPNPQAVNDLQSSYGEAAIVIPRALWNVSGKHLIYNTRFSHCTSILEPDQQVLSRFRVAPLFHVVGTNEVECERYDTLYNRGIVPKPDVLKIDVQGGEYQVLEGFGDLLHSVLAVELETHLYPIYKNQKLLGDLVSFLDQFNLSLRTLREQPNFDGEAVEFNAYFTRRRSGLSEAQLKKLGVVENIWHLRVSNTGMDLLNKIIR